MKRYPCWIPYPSSWARALLTFVAYLFVPLIIVALIIDPASVFSFSPIVSFSPSVWGGISQTLIFMLLPVLVFSPCLCITYIHHWLLGKGHWWLPGVISVWEGVYSFQAMVMATLLFLSVVYYASGAFLVSGILTMPWVAEVEAWEVVIPLGLYVFLAYFYQLEYLANDEKRRRRDKALLNPKTIAP